MLAEDKTEFTKALNLCCSTLRQPLPEVDSLKFWFKLLEPYSLADVKAALIHYMQAGTRFAPVPIDVISHIEKRVDRWVSADEAWAIATRGYDPRNTVETCNEIDAATDAVRHLLEAGDKFNAGRAFKDIYVRLTDAARQTQQVPRWRISLGTDAEQREQVVSKAVSAGRISLADGRAAYPLLASPGDDEPIDPKTAAENRSKVANILAILQKPKAAAVARDMDPKLAESRDAAAEQARKCAEYEAQQRTKAEAEAFRMIASMAHLSDDVLASMVRLMAEHQEVA
ncbi:hypothetical protein [Paraburkholderia bryophila]|uniref:Replicative helicase inhibitor G39P N-terminal domain-containing protein n=1 Tax=Paraburkholderia bryophila TaxID=420952 RepID=A0A7Y9WPE3_9BURK|nr:hypothetical protein [Paraburkholderia bryophila]NYH24674.1 hypothetical protein [Paraburkholderia bryophila]